MRVYHGSILSVNAKNDVFRYLVEKKGRIVYVGNELPAKYRRAETIELGEKALIPAFVDTHQHLAFFSAFHAGLNVMDTTEKDRLIDIRVEKLILRGKDYKPQSQNIANVIVKGMLRHNRVHA